MTRRENIIDEIAGIIVHELANDQHTVSENLRCAATFAIDEYNINSNEFVAAAGILGIRANAARNRFAEGRKFFD